MRRSFLTITASFASVIAAHAHGVEIKPGDVILRTDDFKIVACDAPVQSRKRGICANELSADDFKALSPGVSWFYNWHYRTDHIPPPETKIEFLPMVWGDTPDRIEGLKTYLSEGNKPRAILAINEPNLKDQAFIPPEQTARLYKDIKAIADQYNISVVGPHMAMGSATDASITALDPIENKQVTYTFMVPFLKAVFRYIDPKEVTSVAYHTYGNFGELVWSIDLASKEFDDRPLWITEYAQWDAPDEAAEVRYLIQATDLLERSPNVAGYAWFKERAGDNKKISLFEDESGKLTKLGQIYVAMPVHDAKVIYQIPGKLTAARYVAMDGFEIEPATATNALFQMTSQKENASLDYQLLATEPGSYVVRLNTSGTIGKWQFVESKLKFVPGSEDRILAEGDSTNHNWHTIDLHVELTGQRSAFSLRASASGQKIESIAFIKQPK